MNDKQMTPSASPCDHSFIFVDKVNILAEAQLMDLADVCEKWKVDPATVRRWQQSYLGSWQPVRGSLRQIFFSIFDTMLDSDAVRRELQAEIAAKRCSA